MISRKFLASLALLGACHNEDSLKGVDPDYLEYGVGSASELFVDGSTDARFLAELDGYDFQTSCFTHLLGDRLPGLDYTLENGSKIVRSMRYEFNYSGKSYTRSKSYYSDGSCKNSIFRIIEAGSFRSTPLKSYDDMVHSKSYYLIEHRISYVVVMPESQDYANKINSLGICGGGMIVGQSKDLTNAACSVVWEFLFHTKQNPLPTEMSHREMIFKMSDESDFRFTSVDDIDEVEYSFFPSSNSGNSTTKQ